MDQRRSPSHEAVTTGPIRKPEWRWLRATDLIARNRYISAKRDDELTCRAARLVRALSRRSTERAKAKLRQADPALCEAVQIHQEGGPPELELKARIIAGQSDRAAGRPLGLPADVVAAFAGLFFDVRGSLDSAAYVATAVLRLDPAVPPTPAQLMLQSAHAHGPVIIPAWLDYLTNADDAHDLGTAEGRQREAVELLVKARELYADPDAGVKLLNNLPWLNDIQRKTPKGRSVATILTENAARILRDLPEEALPEDGSDRRRTRTSDGTWRPGGRPRRVA